MGSLDSIFYVLQDDYVMYICYNAAHYIFIYILFTLSPGRVETHMQVFLLLKEKGCLVETNQHIPRSSRYVKFVPEVTKNIYNFLAEILHMISRRSRYN